MDQPGNAIEIADRLHQAGTGLIAGGLDDLLRSYGPACYTGSYFLDLMAWPDLDVYLPLDPSPEGLARFLGLAPGFASAGGLVSLRFKDHVRCPEPALPGGLYWGVRCEQSSGLRWKIDLWALPPQEIAAHQAELERLKRRLTPEKRALILEIKQALLTPEGRTPVLSGYPIYCAVLDRGLDTLAAVKAYLKDQGVSF